MLNKPIPTNNSVAEYLEELKTELLRDPKVGPVESQVIEWGIRLITAHMGNEVLGFETIARIQILTSMMIGFIDHAKDRTKSDECMAYLKKEMPLGLF